MTPEKLAVLRRLHEAATPGEWVQHWDGVFCKGDLVAESWSVNARFIATAHNEWPELLDEVERLRGALEKIELKAREYNGLHYAFEEIQHMATEALGK